MVIGPELLESTEGASVGEDVEEAQELAVDAAGGTHHARQKGVGDTRPRGVSLPVATHLRPRCCLEELVWLGMPERPVEAAGREKVEPLFASHVKASVPGWAFPSVAKFLQKRRCARAQELS